MRRQFDKAGEELTITSDEDSVPAVEINPDDPMIPIMIGMMMVSPKMKAIATTIIRILIQTLLKHITTILMKIRTTSLILMRIKMVLILSLGEEMTVTI